MEVYSPVDILYACPVSSDKQIWIYGLNRTRRNPQHRRDCNKIIILKYTLRLSTIKIDTLYVWVSEIMK